jgi:predicted acylesterase/phospholipase RssA
MTAPRTALILTGGGARAGYQVGVLKAIRELLPEPSRNPFPILCGTSAGAINAASMAVWAEDFGAGVDNLLRLGELQRPSGLSRRPGRHRCRPARAGCRPSPSAG